MLAPPTTSDRSADRSVVGAPGADSDLRGGGVLDRGLTPAALGLNYRFRYRDGGTEMGYVVNKRDRCYAVRYEGIDPVTGRDRRRWHPAAGEVSARSIAESLPAARGSSAHGMTLARFIRTRWLPARQDRLRPTAFYRYRQMTELYVLPRLGRVPLRRLTVAHLQGLCATLPVSGGHDGRPLAPKTCSTPTRCCVPRSATLNVKGWSLAASPG
jgi:hypothetical protein